MSDNIPKHLKVFKGSTVLVTGHTGFKGSWLSKWLTMLGAKVVGYSLAPPAGPSLFKTLGLKNEVVNIIGDVRDPKGLTQVFKGYDPKFVFHLAAQPIVRESYIKPAETFETNVMGTVNVLEGVHRSKSVKSCVIVTSDKCYENREWVHGYRETDPMGGHDPFSASKGAAELTVSSYTRSFFAQKSDAAISSVRAGSIIGGGDWAPDRLVPDCIRALMDGKPILLRNPQSVRPWQFVLDPLHGYLRLSSKMIEDPREFSGAWNFGPSYERSVTAQDIVAMVIKDWGDGTFEHAATDEQKHEAGSMRLDCTKAINMLGWCPHVNLDNGIHLTVDWYHEYAQRKNSMRQYTAAQITNYMANLV